MPIRVLDIVKSGISRFFKIWVRLSKSFNVKNKAMIILRLNNWYENFFNNAMDSLQITQKSAYFQKT